MKKIEEYGWYSLQFWRFIILYAGLFQRSYGRT